jgi:hypothetical protein
MKTKSILIACKRNEKIRRKLYRRVKWMKQNPRKEKFIGLATEDLYPVFSISHKVVNDLYKTREYYLFFRTINGGSYSAELLKEKELLDLYFTDKDLIDMGFVFNSTGYS